MNEKNKYLEKLFNKLAKRHGNKGSYIELEEDDLKCPDDLKGYVYALIRSNIQYDMGIDFTDKDVDDLINSIAMHNAGEMSVEDIYEKDDIFNTFDGMNNISQAYDARLSLQNLKNPKKYSKSDIAQIIYLANESYLKDETSASLNWMYDAIVMLLNEGSTVKKLSNMTKWDLLDAIHDKIPC